ncbi:diaminopimelate decarboxylase [Aurantibacillus circumpalustris]|uniref:diaminopimelate decarboxylase n=1 Tax=Aurantibacillus circumpalustris TaxID=3036359 RepID=UPI00295AE69A|nr:diaminopimelate decarboxylase [Aurantibacillus circumpalustris]
MFTKKLIEHFNTLETPFYYYDTELLEKTLTAIKKSSPKEYHIHYALKANAHPTLLNYIKEAGFGADCVSGNEVKRAIECGFDNKKIVFAGVGKSDKEINYALDHSIFCFNVESLHELQILNQLSKNKNVTANIALRINPNVDAYTHKYITTGLEENKFGINPYEFDQVLLELKNLEHLNLIGLHFHIGSQIQDMTAFKNLCLRVNEINTWFIQKGITPEHLNVGGGLGVNYIEPDKEAIVDFESYFNIFKEFLEVKPKQEIHFELGRCIIAQCGSLISKVLYIKNGINTNFAILDAGMTELIRPALYQAYHKIENISAKSGSTTNKYDVVGPICESSDCFGKAVVLPETERGDLFAIRSAGAYGEVMSNHYNLRDAVKSIFDKEV